jgi:tetrahydromethanopterin S-methyltransferase subunit F
MSAQSLLTTRFNDIPVRSPRGNEMIRRDPRELPRRIRGLLLAINGQQTVGAYVHTLVGFGDVAALLDELMQLGLIELRSQTKNQIRPERARAPADAQESGFAESMYLMTDSGGLESSFMDPHTLSNDSPAMDSVFKDPQHMMNTLYDSTVRGSFEDLVRETRRANPDFMAAPPAPPLTAEVKNKQVESLFKLLEDVRRERHALKRRVEQLRKYRDRSKLLAQENKRLSQGMLALAITCGMLVTVLLVLVYQR